MYSKRLLKAAFLPAATLVAQEKKAQNNQQEKLCRPSELPIYVADPPSLTKEPEKLIQTPTALEESFGTVRKHCTKVFDEVRAYKKVGSNYLAQSKDNAEWLLKYLRKEDNTTPKAGAIAIGGLTGLIFGLRGRFFKRTLYATTGALSMAAVCYPKEASEYSQIAIAEAKKYATIAYNFVYGGGDTEQVIEAVQSELTEADAIAIIERTHEESSSKSCHCPVGACLGQHES